MVLLIELPFVPFSGLFIEDQYSFEVDTVTWDMDEEVFKCSIVNRMDIFDNNAPMFDYEKRKKDLLANGWIVAFES